MGAFLPGFVAPVARPGAVDTLAARFKLTDFEALDANGTAVNHLRANLTALQRFGYSGEAPTPGVDGFHIPSELVAAADVIVAGSPHGHNAAGNFHTREASRNLRRI